MTQPQKERIWPRFDGAKRDAFLHEPRVAILSVARADGGPLAIPIWYAFEGGRFWLDTLPASLHGRQMQRTGRATLTVQEEAEPQRYVCAEGSVRFLSPADLQTLGTSELDVARRIVARYVTPPQLQRWMAAVRPALNLQIALLTPEMVWAAALPTVEEIIQSVGAGGA